MLKAPFSCIKDLIVRASLSAKISCELCGLVNIHGVIGTELRRDAEAGDYRAVVAISKGQETFPRPFRAHSIRGENALCYLPK